MGRIFNLSAMTMLFRFGFWVTGLLSINIQLYGIQFIFYHVLPLSKVILQIFVFNVNNSQILSCSRGMLGDPDVTALLFFNIRGVTEAQSVGGDHALTPPRGWNSYDSFCWNINETEFLKNAELVAKWLAPHGYQYVVVDFLWYRRKDFPGASTTSAGTDTIDGWGRVVPDPSRWSSANNDKGFTEVASKVHQMGLKFGIHVMRGLSFEAYDADSIILDTTKGTAYEEGGRVWTAKDIVVKDRACKWMDQGFMAVNTSLGAGKAFLRSLYTQYAQWGVDYVKHDCVFGDDFDLNEISYVSELLREFDRPIIYSISPGTNVKPELAKNISGLVNMYRVTGDDWDQWEHVKSHFDVARDFAAANMIGAQGLKGRSWPDLDMLPLGWLTNADSNEGPYRQCNLTLEEQETQVTLWSMAKSPLMFGGDMRNLDELTYRLITNPVLLEINSFSTNNKEFPFVTGAPASNGWVDVRAWVAKGRSGKIYLAFFNLSSAKMAITAKRADVFSSLGLTVRNKRLNTSDCQGKELWSGQYLGTLGDSISSEVEPHGTALFVITC